MEVKEANRSNKQEKIAHAKGSWKGGKRGGKREETYINELLWTRSLRIDRWIDENPVLIEGVALNAKEILGQDDLHLREEGEERPLGFEEKEMEAMRELERGGG